MELQKTITAEAFEIDLLMDLYGAFSVRSFEWIGGNDYKFTIRCNKDIAEKIKSKRSARSLLNAMMELANPLYVEKRNKSIDSKISEYQKIIDALERLKKLPAVGTTK